VDSNPSEAFSSYVDSNPNVDSNPSVHWVHQPSHLLESKQPAQGAQQIDTTTVLLITGMLTWFYQGLWRHPFFRHHSLKVSSM